MSPRELIEHGRSFGLPEQAHANLRRSLHKLLLKRLEAHLLQINCAWHCVENALQLLFRHVDIFTKISHLNSPDFQRRCMEKIPPKLRDLKAVLSSTASYSSVSSTARYERDLKRRALESSGASGPRVGPQMAHVTSQERFRGADKAKMRERCAFIDKLAHRLTQLFEGQSPY